MTAATQNEMERLRSERDAMKQQLDEALEREAALAAHVEVLESMRLEAQRDYIEQYSDGETDCVTPFDHPGSVDASLARRDLIKQAEALEEVSRDVKSMRPKCSPVGIGVHIGIEAKKLRQQAEGLT